jgi:uncharacterized repeat protein (TIGR03843 family)
MPEDERPPPAPHLSAQEWRELLSGGELEIEGRMPWSSNATFLVRVEAEGLCAYGVYKPAAGERPLWDFPAGLARREAAAYELGRMSGLDVVPVTVLRDGPLGRGSLQRFVDADFSEHYFTLRDAGEHDAALRRIAGYDLLANNADRKGGHFLLDAHGCIWGIDNGLCFHTQPKLRTVAWDFAGEALPDEVLQACARLSAGGPGALETLLEPNELRALVGRARRLLERPVYPHPDLEERCYPWPLV